jgi:hypothetical protein
MSEKILSRWFLTISLVGMVVLLALEIIPVHAQCENPPESSCATCHAREYPVNDEGEWHIIHGDKDICLNCHGGNGTAVDKNLAHEGLMANPLDDIYTDCHSCHPGYDTRAEQFAKTLGITPGGCATPTPMPVGNAPVEPSPGNINNMSISSIGTTPSSFQSFLMIGVGFSIPILFLFALIWLKQQHIKS